MRLFCGLGLLVGVFVVCAENAAAPPLYAQVQLFKSGEHGYHTYRIPAP